MGQEAYDAYQEGIRAVTAGCTNVPPAWRVVSTTSTAGRPSAASRRIFRFDGLVGRV